MADDRPLPRRLLFVGDSLTYVNDLDLHVKAFMEAADPRAVVEVDRVVQGGAPLKTLWKKTEARKRIEEGGFDVVVLQEDLPETDVASFKSTARRFHQVIEASGARTVLLMAWAYERLGWISMEEIARAHWEIAAELGALVAPVGLAWQRAQETKIKLYAKDGEHPSPCGTYLAAATVFALLWRQSPVGMACSAAPAVRGANAERLQRAAWEEVRPLLGSAADASSAARVALVAEAFAALDADRDGRLSSAEWRGLADFLGVRGGEAAREEEFAALCAELRCSPREGLPLEAFRKLVDEGTEQGLFCTHCTSDELRELLAAQPSRAAVEPSAPALRRVVIVPGNGCGSVWDANWYGWLATELQRRGVEVGMKDMPDPLYARETKWLPFIADHLAGGVEQLASTIVVGHSSGAVAAMRLAERHRVGGVVLVAAYTSDLGDPTERKSGYFSRPWDWQKQRDNAGFIVQFASTDDPFLPIEEQRVVRDGLAPKMEYVEFDGRSHFFSPPFWELLELLERKLGRGSREGGA